MHAFEEREELVTGGTRKRRRRDDTKRRLQEAVVELTAGISYQELRIESIAEAAGLSRSAFYFYYRDKHELLIDAARDINQALYRQADVLWHGEGEPQALIESALEGVATTWLEHRDLLRLITEVATYDDEVGDAWGGLIGRFTVATAEFIERQQADGLIDRGLQAAPVAEVLILAAERSLSVAANGGRPMRETVDALAVVWTRSLYGPR